MTTMTAGSLVELTEVSSSQLSRRRWRHPQRSGRGHSAGRLGIWVRWDDWVDIWNIFLRDEEASHVILTPIVVAALIWVRRERLRKIHLRTSWLGPAFVAVGMQSVFTGKGMGINRCGILPR